MTALTGPSLCATRGRSSGPSLTAGSVVPSAQAVLRPPPTPTRHPSTSRLNTGYRTRRSDRTRIRRPPGRGGPPRFPPSPSERSEPHTPGGSSGLQSRIYTPSMTFAVTVAARLLLFPPAGGVLTTRQASLDATDRSIAPPTGLSTLRFDPGRFPPFVGFVTFERALQSSIEDTEYARRIARLRGYYFGHAPEIAPYLLNVAPAELLLMQRVPGDRWQGYRTVAGMVAVITAVLAGSTAALAAILIFDHSLVAVPTMIAMIRYQDSAWERAATAPLSPGED